jgi:O-antigen ligase
VAGTALATLWPTAAILLGALLIVLALSIRMPAYAFALALALYSFEGTFKMRLSLEGAPSPVALGAAALDFAFLASLTALLFSDRGRSLVLLWNRMTRPERIAGALLGAWLVLSVVQIPLNGNIVDALEGFRLTQLYVPAALGGVVLAARLGAERLAPLLLCVILLAVAYAGFRGITGPTAHEQAFAERRAFNATFGEVGRNTGSFTGPVGLVSFLVPAALICLVLGFLRADRRTLCATLFALAMTGIIGSFVRTALVAVIVGVGLLAVLLLARKGAARRRGALALVLMATVLGGGYAATLLAGAVTPTTEQRAKGLADPLSDYSVTTRLDRWGKILGQVADEPLGTGLGTVGRATSHGRVAKFTDNSYLKVLKEQGILGGLLFIGGLAGILVALAIRLARQDPSRRALGTAALAAFSGFAVLMIMGEYIEQPGKLLAWTLLGVAVWEACGRSRSEPEATSFDWPGWRSSRQRIGSAVSRARRLERPVLGVLLGAMLIVVAVPTAIRAASEREYRSSTYLLSAPPGSNARWQRTIQGLLNDPSFLVRAAAGGSIRASELPGHLSARFVRGPRLRFSVVARAGTPGASRRLATTTGQAIVRATYVSRTASLKAERRRLRRELRAGGHTAASRAATRRRIEKLDLSVAAIALYSAHQVESSKPAPRALVERVASDLSGRTAAPSSPAWAGLAALIFVLALMAALATARFGRRAS